MDNKYSQRIYALNLRKNLNIKQKSELAVNILKNNSLYINAKNIMIYHPTKYEINLLSLLQDLGKYFYLPKVDNQNLIVCPFDNQCKMEKSCFNILEPCTNPVNPKILDLIIVPALMADKENYRLGYGKGFYDRFLNNLNIKTICIVPKELFVDKLPSDKFDKKIDLIIPV